MNAKILVGVILAVVVIAAALNLLLKTGEKYVCYDGSVVPDPGDCATTTTTEPSTTTLLTTTTKATRTTVMMTSTTTTVPADVACFSDADCVGPDRSKLFCHEGNVKVQILKYFCRSPGSPESECITTPTATEVIDSCDNNEYCLNGKCYSLSCFNKKRDPGEVWVDCGGACPVCTENDTMCYEAGDCGKEKCSQEYYCKDMNVVVNCTAPKCVNPGRLDASCTEVNTTKVVDYCGVNKKCVDGWHACVYGATCSDCERNQGEEEMDCGGPCRPCAKKPHGYSTLEVTTSSNASYGGYEFRLLKVLYNNKCPYGASIQILRQDSVFASGSVNIYESKVIGYGTVRFNVGVIGAKSNSVTLWALRES